MKKISILLVLLLTFLPPLIAQESWESYPDIKNCYGLAAAPDGTVWAATYNGAYRYHSGTWTLYNSQNTPAITNNNFRSVYIDRSGNVWLGTYDTSSPSGVFKFDGTNWTHYTTSNSGLAGNQIFGVREDAAGNLWFGTYGSGISRLSPDNTWTSYNTQNVSDGLPGNLIYTLAIAPNGDKWFSAYSYGASRLSGETWTFYDMNFLTNNGKYVRGIVADSQGSVWIATYAGVARLTGSTWTTFTTTNSGLSRNITNTIHIDSKNNKWIGMASPGGVSKFDGTNWKTYDVSDNTLLENTIQSIAVDAYGKKWFATTEGIAVLTDEDALPLKLLSFSAVEENRTNLISWVTVQEENVSGFEIQRSADGAVFSPQAFVKALNRTELTEKYTYTDPTPIAGKNYYRLRMEDTDGTYTFSPIVAVKSSVSSQLISVYPNPATKILNIESTTRGLLTAELFDLTGKRIAHTDRSHLDITPVPSGTYLLTIADQEGIREFRRIVILK